MASFTTRVELHNADYDDYETLHEAMERKGFSRFIVNRDGSAYHLPTAEYDYKGNESRKEVLALAQSAADETNRKYAVLITESNGRTWSGLNPA